MQLSHELRTWLLSGKHPDPTGREAAIRRKMVARLEKINQSELRVAGDVVGHEFHGNQWTSGYGPGAQGVNTHTKPAAQVSAARTGKRFEATLYRGVNPRESEKINRIPSQFAVGEYRTPFPEVAATYGQEVREVPTVLKNPYVFTLGERAYFEELRSEFGTNRPEEITRKLVGAGHDGLIVKNVPMNRGELTMRDSAEVIVFKQFRQLGDLPGHEFHGNQYTDVAGEMQHQRELADKQENPLAHPDFVVGVPTLGMREGSVAARRYVAAYGQEFKAQPLPSDIERGKAKECYRNASMLVMTHPELTYVEGFAKSAATGDMTFMHAWAIDKDGNVIDNTWDHPEKAQYFGVAYDRSHYLQSLYKAQVFGVLGATDEIARKAVETGGHGLRSKR
jgi:hypothetical protein